MTVTSPPMEAVGSVIYPYAIARLPDDMRGNGCEERSVMRETEEKNLSIVSQCY